MPIPEVKVGGLHARLVHLAEHEDNPVAAEMVQSLEPPSPSVETFRERIAGIGLTQFRSQWEDSPSGKEKKARVGLKRPPPPQFDEDTDSEPEQATGAEVLESPEQLHADIFAISIYLGLKKLKSGETAMTFVREYLKNTFTPWFGEDSKLLTQLIEDNVSFKKFTEWAPGTRRQLIGDFMEEFAEKMVEAEHRLGNDVVLEALKKLTSRERTRLLKYLKDDKDMYNVLKRITPEIPSQKGWLQTKLETLTDTWELQTLLSPVETLRSKSAFRKYIEKNLVPELAKHNIRPQDIIIKTHGEYHFKDFSFFGQSFNEKRKQRFMETLFNWEKQPTKQVGFGPSRKRKSQFEDGQLSRVQAKPPAKPKLVKKPPKSKPKFKGKQFTQMRVPRVFSDEKTEPSAGYRTPSDRSVYDTSASDSDAPPRYSQAMQRFGMRRSPHFKRHMLLTTGSQKPRTGPIGLYSVRAFYRRPIERAHVVKLKSIRERARAEKPLHDDISMQLYGFNFNAWLKQNELAAPVMSMEGKKTNFGNIVTNRRSGAFTFKIVKRTTPKMKRALYNYISNMFDLGLAKVYVKRKAFELVSGVNSIKGLNEYITSQMRGRRQVIFRISW